MARFALTILFSVLPASLSIADSEPYQSPFSDYSFTTGVMLPSAAGPQSTATAAEDLKLPAGALDARNEHPGRLRHARSPIRNPNDTGSQKWSTPILTARTPEAVFRNPTAAPLHGHSLFGTVQTAGSGPAGRARQPGCTTCGILPCEESGRQFAVQINSVYTFRRDAEGQRLFFNPAAPGESVDAGQFGLGSSPGVESTFLWYDPQALLDFEVRAQWIDEWNARVDQPFSGVTVQIDSNPVLGLTGPRNSSAIYASQFGSVEINARHRLGRGSGGITLVGGLRHMRLDEAMNATLADPAGILPNEMLRVRTDNDLYGLQVGVDNVLASHGRLCILFRGRVGLYGNAMDQQSQLVSQAAPPVTFDASDKLGELAFHAETGMTAKFQLHPCVNLTAGMQSMFVDGVALAPQQLATTNFLTNSGLHSNEYIVLHSATVGLEFVY